MSAPRPASPAGSFADLLARARLGQSAAMGELLELHREHLLERARERMPQRLQGRMGPSDAVQVALMSAHQHFEQFRGDSPGEFSEWLWAILLNTIRDFVRAAEGRWKQHLRREVPLDDLPVETRNAACHCPGRSGCDVLIHEETTEGIRRCVEVLPETYRRVLRLRFDDELGFEEIGAELGISAAAARKMRLRALRAVAELMRMFSIIEGER
jgi:RNA polymerase sigma-70 factor (ECF subfamily)